MVRKLPLWTLLLLLAGCTQPSRNAQPPLPSVPEAVAVLRDFRGEYSYGGVGVVSRPNDGELAAWIIFRSPDAAKKLTELYPLCQRTGKAYVLAALYRADKTAFQKLANAFCQEPGDIITGSGCIISSETRTELVADMQRSDSTMAFDPSRPPFRRNGFRFVGNHHDVYAEHQAWEDSQKAEKAHAIATLEATPALCDFTNLFRVDEPGEGHGFMSLYFEGPEWHAHLTPIESLEFPSMVEITFPNSNGIVQVGLHPSELIGELKELNRLPFLKKLDKELNVTCVRIRAAGDRLNWSSDEAAQFEAVLHSGVPLKDWIQVYVDAGTAPRRKVGLYHPKGTDTYVEDGFSLFESLDWRAQYTKITGKKPKLMDEYMWDPLDRRYTAIVDRSGKLTLLDSGKKLP